MFGGMSAGGMMSSAMNINAQRTRDTATHFVNNYNSAKEYRRSKNLTNHNALVAQNVMYHNLLNAPSAQMAGLKKAGINPILAYSKGGPTVGAPTGFGGNSAPKQNFQSNASADFAASNAASASAKLLREQANTEKVRQMEMISNIKLKEQGADIGEPFSELIKNADIAGSARSVGDTLNEIKKQVDKQGLWNYFIDNFTSYGKKDNKHVGKKQTRRGKR